MKKIIFTVNTKKETDLKKVGKAIEKILGKIQINNIENTVTGQNVKNIETFIEVVEQYYNIENVVFDNVLESSSESQNNKFTYLENLLEKIRKKAEDITEKQIGTEKEISEYLISVINELEIRYNPDMPKINIKEEIDKSFEKYETEESLLLKYYNQAFLKLGKTGETFKEKLDIFLKDIKLTNNLKVKRTFEAALKVEKINLETIINFLAKEDEKKQKEIKNSLNNTVQIWLRFNPEIKEKCPKISIIPILKLFVQYYK